VEAQPQRDVVGDGAAREQRLLEHRRHPAPLAQRVARVHLAALEADGAVGRRFQQAEHAEQRGLAAAVRTDDGEDLARPDGQRGDVEDRPAAVAHPHALEREQGGHAGSTWIEPRWIENSHARSRSISRIS
jgi:hypothetical protein